MFLNNLRAGPTSDPGSDFWFSPVSTPTVSGSIVTSDTAMRLSTVYKCIKVLSETIGMLPMHMYRRLPKGRDRVRDHAVAKLLAVRPNRWQTPMQFKSMMEAHRSMRGNAYAEIFYTAGEPDELVPLHPDRVTPEVASNGMPRYRVRDANGQNERTLVPGEIFHLTGLTLDGYKGLNPIEAEREAIGAAIAARDFGSRFWNNDARPPFWIEVPGKFKDTEASGSFREQWQSLYGGSNRGRPAALDNGMKIHELGINNTDAQWIDARKYSDVDLCGLWRIPPHKIGILDRATWGNIEHQNIEFVTDALLPLAVSWEQTVWRDLLVDEDLFVELLLELLLRGDTATRYEAYGKGIKDGWLSRNEARERENMNPLPGLDEPLQPLNMTPVGQALGLPGGNKAGSSPTRAAALLAANAERVYRKEAGLLARRKPGESLAQVLEGHARFVAEVMAVAETSANEYIAATITAASGHEPAVFDSPEWKTQQIAALMRLEG